MDQPYDNSEDFNEDVKYEENITLTCGDTGGEFRHWIRPDMTVMEKNSSEFFKVLYGSAGWSVDSNGVMHIIFVQEDHFGFYYCTIYDSGTYIYVKKALNYKGPYFGDLWDTYEMNFIIGLSAAGGFLLACLVIFVVHHFFFSSSDPDYEPDNSRVAVELADDYSGLKLPESEKGMSGMENGAYTGGKQTDVEVYTQL